MRYAAGLLLLLTAFLGIRAYELQEKLRTAEQTNEKLVKALKIADAGERLATGIRTRALKRKLEKCSIRLHELTESPARIEARQRADIAFERWREARYRRLAVQP